MTLRERFERVVERWLSGEVSTWAYTALRIGLALLFILRHADWLQHYVELEHHRWVHGLANFGVPERAPFLDSPLVPGLVLGAAATRLFVVLRTALSFSLLFGVRARFSAVALALVSYVVFAADRYRFFHHLHLLYVSIGLLALAPIGARLSLERGVALAWNALNRRTGVVPFLPATAPFWPLVVVRAQVLAVYVGAFLSKLDPAWWSGDTLYRLDDIGVARGLGLWIRLFGFSGIAKLACLTELGLALLLCWRPTRRFGVIAAVLFHGVLGSTIAVSTFGARMVLMLLSFWLEPREGPKGQGRLFL